MSVMRNGMGTAPMKSGTVSGPMIRVFGGVGVDDATGPVSIGGPKQRRLLALLAMRSGSVVSVDWLAEYLWDDDERPEATAPAIRTYLSRLRQALPEAAREWIETEPSGYRLAAPADAVEHLHFAMLRAEATRARGHDDPLTAHTLLGEALQLWRGDPFRDLEDLDWARADIERLNLERLEMLEEQWEAALALGRHTQITGELAAFTSEHGDRDRAVQQYALALHRSGRTAEALRVVADHRRLLADESGLDPSRAMVELEQSLLAGDPSLDVEKAGRPLRGYRLLEQAGTGAFSVVWRGEQPSVNREVAIKQIRSDLASQPEFIRRFEAEAHLVARLEHPHIVPLIDFWRDPDSAYLVMRWLPGGTLERRLDDGAMTVADTMTLARQIGGALATAHSRGIVHRDVKTANILFDEQGNAFLGDFGIALEATESAGPEAALSPGSPVYAAPEQIRGEPLGPEADVFSLGVVIFECLTGSLPFPATSSAEEMIDRQLHTPYPSLAELRTDVPSNVSAAVAKATSKNALDRFTSIADFVTALEAEDAASESSQISGDRTPGQPAGEVANPYLGLRAFDDGDSARFFGRERLVTEILGRLSSDSVSSRCVVVVGPSGSGKSSVVRAGLAPALRAGAIDGSSDWFTTTMVPGNDPYESLEAALLRIAINPPDSLLGQLRDGPRGILRSIRRCLGADSDHLLVVIDQFEEIFTGASKETADRFLDALAVAVVDPISPLRLVVTLRADYYHRPLEHPAFATVLTTSAVDVTPLAADELERAIIEPARQVGVTFEPGLVARIAAETVGQPSPLPLLQYTLSELFDRRAEGEDTLTIETYDGLGGLSGALSFRADSIYDRANEAERVAIRRIFGRMTNPREGSADLRQRVPIADLGADAETAWVLDQFGAARLVTFDRDVASREPTVEVAHEALMREWPRLVGWLEDDRDVLRTADSIASAATAWDRGGREASDHYRGGRLDSAVDLAIASADRLRPIDAEFIESSRSAAESDQFTEQRRVRRLRRLVVGVAAALVVALVAGGIALRQGQRADDEADAARAAAAEASSQADLAETAAEEASTQATLAQTATRDAELATLISRSAALSADDPDVSMLLALEAHRRSPEPATEQAVLNALGNNTNAGLVASFPFLATPADCPAPSFVSSDGLRESGIVDGRLIIQDLVTGDVTDHGESPVACGVWLGDESAGRAMVGSGDASRMWLGTFDDPDETEVFYDIPRFLQSRSFSGERLVFGLATPDQASVVLVDALTGDQVGAALTGTDVFDLSLSDDGTFLAISFVEPNDPKGDGRIVIVDAGTGEEVSEIWSDVPATSMVFDASTLELVTAVDDGTLMTIDIATGEIVSRIDTETTSDIADVGVRSDGLITVVSQGRIELLDRRSGPTGRGIDVRNILGARFRKDDSIVVLTTDLQNEIYDLDASALVEESWSIDPLSQVSFNGGHASVIQPPDVTPEVIDLATGERSSPDLVDRDGDQFRSVWVYPEADALWAIDPNGVFGRWEDGELVEQVDIEGQPVTGTRYEDRFAAVRVDLDGTTTVQLVSLEEGSAGIEFGVPSPDAATAHPGLDGGLHVLDIDGTLRTYDASGTQTAEVDTGARNVRIITLDSVSGRLALADGSSGGIVLVHPSTGEVEELRTNDAVGNLGWARDGEMLVITSFDGTVRLWDVVRGESAGLMFEGSGAVVGSPSWYDESTDSVLVASSGKLLRLPIAAERWVERACDITNRDFTQNEWDRFVPGDEPLRAACG